jgi:uncharacterized protein YrrD
MAMTAVLVGRPVLDRKGERVGKVVDMISDPQTLEPQWAAVKLGLLKGNRLVPIEAVQEEEGTVWLSYTREEIREAPPVEVGTPTEAEQQQLCEHYGIGRL